VIRQNRIVRAGCLAHARRKVKTALDTGSKAAARMLRPIQRLFWIERAVLRRAERLELDRDGLLELRQRVRETRSRAAWAWLYREVEALRAAPSTLPKSKLGKALGYLDRQRDPLATFLGDPRIPIHNNDTERDLRHLAVGRKNWLVFGSPRGGQVACRLYSLMLSCKQAGVDPELYIEDLLAKVGTTPHSEIASLTPWAWQAARAAADTTA
jgi:transposase